MTAALLALAAIGALGVLILASYLTSYRLVVPLMAGGGGVAWFLPYGTWAPVSMGLAFAFGLPLLAYLSRNLRRARRTAAAWNSLVNAFHSADRSGVGDEAGYEGWSGGG